MQVELILVRLGVVEHLHVAALHAHSQPFTRWAVAQWEDLKWNGKQDSFSTMASISVGAERKSTSEKLTWEVKSCCCSCRPSLRSHERTVLSRPPVHSLVPSWEMSMQLAPSVWPWNCLEYPQGSRWSEAQPITPQIRVLLITSSQTYLTSVWLWRSHTAMLPSLQQEKQTLASGLMARA